jgi:hypothetical protein
MEDEMGQQEISYRQGNLTKDRARLLGVLAEATEARDAARAAFNAAQVAMDANANSRTRKAWHSAADDLDWWIGRVAFLSAWAKSAEGAPSPADLVAVTL